MSEVQEYSEVLRQFFFTAKFQLIRVFDPLKLRYVTKFCIQGKCYSRVKQVLVLQRDFDTARKLLHFGIHGRIVMLELLCFDWLRQTRCQVIMRVDCWQKNFIFCSLVSNYTFENADVQILCADLLRDFMVPPINDIVSTETLCDNTGILIAPNILTLVRSIYADGS